MDSRKYIYGFSLSSLVLTALWVITMITGAVDYQRMQSVMRITEMIMGNKLYFYITYINAGLITISVSMLFAALYLYIKNVSQFRAIAGAIFIPVYCLLNLTAYFSQVVIIPGLAQELASNPESRHAAFALRIFLQQFPGSFTGFINILGYAVLAVPSIIYGWCMLSGSKMLKAAGALLISNGLACIIGFAGMIAGHESLMFGTTAGGGLFLVALIFLMRGFKYSNIKEK